MADLIVITGGAHSGKTGLIEALSARGHEVLPEAAMEIIDELVRDHGVEAQARWRETNQVAFQRLITERQHAREIVARRSEAAYVFCDRGALDGKAYCEHAGVTWPDDLRSLVTSARYAHVFVLATLLAFDARPETGRTDEHRDSVRVSARLEATYRPRTGGVTRVPEMPISARVDLVLGTLGA